MYILFSYSKKKLIKRNNVWPSASCPSSQELMGLAVLCGNCFPLGFTQMIWERKGRWEKESKVTRALDHYSRGSSLLPLLGSRKTTLWQLRAHTASSEGTRWLTTAIWACTSPTPHLTHGRTWFYLGCCVVQCSEIVISAKQGWLLPRAAHENWGEWRKRGLGRRDFWKLPQTTAPQLDQGVFHCRRRLGLPPLSGNVTSWGFREARKPRS